MLGNLSGWHMVIILAIVLLMFGAPKLPALARSLGQSAKILKSEMGSGKKDAEDAEAASAGTAASTTADSVAEPAAPAASPTVVVAETPTVSQQPKL